MQDWALKPHLLWMNLFIKSSYNWWNWLIGWCRQDWLKQTHALQEEEKQSPIGLLMHDLTNFMQFRSWLVSHWRSKIPRSKVTVGPIFHHPMAHDSPKSCGTISHVGPKSSGLISMAVKCPWSNVHGWQSNVCSPMSAQSNVKLLWSGQKSVWSNVSWSFDPVAKQYTVESWVLICVYNI